MLLPESFAELLRPPLLPWFALALGLVVGSFANVCIHRIPSGQSVVSPRSRCPGCSASIRAADNLPILSFILLGGRCRHCRTPISVRYPLVEAANGLLYMGLAWRFGGGAPAALAMVFATLLLILSLIDLDHHLLPDVLTLPGILLGLAASFVRQPPSPLEAAVSALVGYLALGALARAAEWYYGEEALGQGDWKMVAMLGAFLGAKPTLLAVLVGTLCGAMLGVGLIAVGRGSGRTRLPLGTFLGMGGLLTLLAGRPLLAWYGALFGV
jgi:leader peptidase (prepilin peptidase) / N-methyltransferase